MRSVWLCLGKWRELWGGNELEVRNGWRCLYFEVGLDWIVWGII